MFRYFVILAIVGIAVGQNVEEPETFMTGGIPAIVGEFPAAVFIRTPNLAQSFCGGTIVNNLHVLTSAQCVVNAQNRLVNPFWFQVIAGDADLLTPTSRRQVRRVTRIYIHPNFNPTSRRNDLAVLRVDAPFPAFSNSIEPVVRTSRFIRDGTQCRVAGWGAVNNNAGTPIQQQIRVLNANVLPRANCNANNVHANRVLDVHICAGNITTSNPAAGACAGNVGSGLYCGNELAGVLSFGLSCGAANNPGVYMNVRLYNTWINEQFTRTDIPEPGWISTPN
jgi:RIO kinase 1